MKTFEEMMEALLLERELDRPTRDAARKSFERFKKNLMVILRRQVAAFVKDMAENRVFHYTMDSDHTIANNLIHAFTLNQPSSHFVLATKNGWDVVIAMCIRDESQMVLPSYITMKQYRQLVDKGNIVLLQTTLRSTTGRSMFSSGNAKGTYHSGKMGRNNPEVQIHHMETLQFKPDKPFHHAIIQTLRGKIEGKSAQALARPLNKWLDQFEAELSNTADIYIHEFIHLFDDFRYKSKSSHPGNIKRGIDASYDSKDVFKKDYYTSDAEWNAYFQSAAEIVENAVQSFLIAATNERSAAKALAANSNFNTMTPTARCKEVAEVVVAELYRKMSDAIAEPWAREHATKFGLDKYNMGAVGNFCLIFVSWQAYSTAKFFLEEPKRREKFLSRTVSLLQDVRNIISEYNSRMAQGKVPTVQEFNKAIANMKRTDGTKMQNVYNNIYSGLMMGKKPFDPRKPVNEE
jgi:hypothetical protein